MTELQKVIDATTHGIEGKCVVVLSGGQDSVTSLFWARHKFSEVYAISFNYGQNHAKELELAKAICEEYDVTHRTIDISSMMEVTQSALIDGGDVNEENAKGLPSSFVPNRNQMFLTLAHSYAQLMKAEAIITGVCQTDFSGYPDCRRAFIDNLQITTNMGSEENIEILTPIMYIDKADTFALADSLGILGIILNRTLTCYNGDMENKHEWGMGCDECPACQLRKEGYGEYIERHQQF